MKRRIFILLSDIIKTNHYCPIKNSDIVTDSSLYFYTFRITMEFAKDKISINMSKVADSSLRSLFFKPKKI